MKQRCQGYSCVYVAKSGDKFDVSIKYKIRKQGKRKTAILGSFVLASDAARIRDLGFKKYKCKHNDIIYDSKEKYLRARAEEMKKYAIREDQVPTVEAMESEFKQYGKIEVPHVRWPNPFCKTSMMERCKDYKNVSVQIMSIAKGSYKFRANCTHQKSRSLGVFMLASDAAYVADCIGLKFGIIEKPWNFPSLDDFLAARAKEIDHTGLSVGDIDTVEAIETRIVDEWNRHSKDDNDH